MSSIKSWSSVTVPLALTLLCTLLLVARTSTAQQDGTSGYHTSETSVVDDVEADGGYSLAEAAADKAADKGDLRSEGPVRMARFSFVEGNVTWREGSTGDWSQATVNMPVRQNAEILVLKGGRADLQFDDGSELRLGNGALVTLKTLYSDNKGEFTQITLKDGLATLHSRHTDSVYQIDTPILSVKSVGPCQVRFGVDGGSEVAVQLGSATVEGSQGKRVINAGNYVFLSSPTTAYNIQPSPAPDTWDKWNTDRNKLITETTDTRKHVPANIGLVAGDLDAYGTWHQDAAHGWVWVPNDQVQDWRPYENGSWVWVDPYGWTWVSNEPWGWAPYHYGTWFQSQWGWSWCPGPYSQYWSPGVVGFTDDGSDIGWAPLSPWEVTYPTYCGLGLWGPNWGLDFSIGWCGCYYPFGGGYCEGRRFDNRFVNRFHDHAFGLHDGLRDRGIGKTPGSRSATGFVPANARNGSTAASRAAFAGNGNYLRVSNGTSMFGAGKTMSVPARGGAFSGPSVQPSAGSRSAAGVGRSSENAAEVARSARTTLGYTGRVDYSRSAETSGSFSGRSVIGSVHMGRSFSSGGFSAGRSYGGYGAGAYRGAATYGGHAGGFSGRGRNFTGGGRAFSGARSSGGGGSRGFSGGARSGGGHSGGRR